MTLTRIDLVKIKEILDERLDKRLAENRKEISEEIDVKISGNNLKLLGLLEKTFVTKVEFKEAIEKFATKEDLAKVQDLVVLINHKLDTEYRFIQRRGEENTGKIDRNKEDIQGIKQVLDIAP